MRRMEEAFEAVSADEPDADIAYLAARLGRSLALAGELERAAEANELALGVAQALRLPETLVRALGTKAYLSRAAGRPEEELALARHALRYALENDLAEQAANGYANLSDSCFGGDRYGEALEALGEAVALARRSGERAAEVFALSETTYALTMTGRWDEAVAIFDELPEEQLRADSNLSSVLSGVLEIFLHRGQIGRSRELHSWFDYVPSEDQQESRHPQSDAGCAPPRGRQVRRGHRRRLIRRRNLERAPGHEAGPRLGRRVGAGPRRARPRGRAAADRRGARAGPASAVPRGAGTTVPGSDERRSREVQGCRSRLPRVRHPLLARRHAARARRADRATPSSLDEAREIFESLRATPWIERTNAADRRARPYRPSRRARFGRRPGSPADRFPESATS